MTDAPTRPMVDGMTAHGGQLDQEDRSWIARLDGRFA
jgi:hypothetical protein